MSSKLRDFEFLQQQLDMQIKSSQQKEKGRGMVVCMYVCMHVCLNMYVYMHVFVCMHVWSHIT